jgi:hypothetical protein
MKNMIRISKILQIVVMLAFFLPFFPQGCKPKQAEIAPEGVLNFVEEDTLNANNVIDSTKQLESDNTNIDTTQVRAIGRVENENKTNDKSLSDSLSKRFKILKPFLRPSDNYSGIGYCLDILSYFYLYAVVFSLFLFILGFLLKLRSYNQLFLFINNLALLFLLFAHGPNILNQERLWGYWVCLALVIILVIYDTIVFMKIKKQHEK